MEEEEDIFAFDSLFYTESKSREQAPVSLVERVFQRRLYFCPTHVVYPSTYTLDRLHAKVLVKRTNEEVDSSRHDRFWVYSVFLWHASLQSFSSVWHRSVPRVFDRSFSQRGVPSVWLPIVSSPHVSEPIQVRYHSNSIRESLEWPADHRVVPLCGRKERSAMSQRDSWVALVWISDLKNDRSAWLERRNSSLPGRLFHISQLFWVRRIQQSHHHLLRLEAVPRNSSPVIQSEYKVWRQRDYSFLYSISDERIQEVRVGSMCSYELSDRKGMVLVAQEAHFIPTGDLLVMPIMVLALYTGEIIYRANFFLHSTNEVEFLEVFEEYIFIKQRDHRLVIYSVATRKHPSISRWFRIESWI